jgi:hypothetical protein
MEKQHAFARELLGLDEPGPEQVPEECGHQSDQADVKASDLCPIGSGALAASPPKYSVYSAATVSAWRFVMSRRHGVGSA